MWTQDEVNGPKLIDHLYELWTMEHRIIDSLPGMIEKVYDGGLKNILRLHYSETLNQTSSLRGIFKQLDCDIQNKPDDEFSLMLDQADDAFVDEAAKSTASDQLIISFCKKIEDYEIGKYSIAIAQAKLLRLDGVVKVLYTILNEEKLAKVKLDFVAKNIADGQSRTLESQKQYATL
jgi:ferritin-like metal-binding protein YciE